MFLEKGVLAIQNSNTRLVNHTDMILVLDQFEASHQQSETNGQLAQLAEGRRSCKEPLSVLIHAINNGHTKACSAPNSCQETHTLLHVAIPSKRPHLPIAGPENVKVQGWRNGGLFPLPLKAAPNHHETARPDDFPWVGTRFGRWPNARLVPEWIDILVAQALHGGAFILASRKSDRLL